MRTTGIRRIPLLPLALLALATVAAGEAPHPARATEEIRIEDAWARAGLQGRNSAVYMRILNRGGSADRLVGVATEAAEKAELHETVVQGGTMRMRPVPAVEVPAGGRAVLKPGGRHVMLVRLRRTLVEGDTVPLRLTFERAGSVEVSVGVRPAGAMARGAGGGHD